MSASTENLIRAIQTNDSLAFYGWLRALQGTPDLDAGVVGDPGITPLAVAAVMYANVLKSDRHRAGRYAAMVAALLDAGANPLVRIGERFVVKRNHLGKLEQRRVADGKTLAEVCEGVLAPAMQAWFARYTVDRMNTELHRHHPAFVRSARHVAEVA
ncbi:hypothetical protein [Xanthomonas campestris]|uniref:hypothetical protein n=1 Tax=Xanthomonas campestris TaxID=339 RepID=UPI002B22BDF8|nr:hypothetical protein [Xanthomonas campestris]MEA9920791.1 hypothetical protein [Xanthomonas campestris pv. raphani]